MVCYASLHLADVGRDEERDTGAEAVSLLEKLVQADHDDAGKQKLRARARTKKKGQSTTGRGGQAKLAGREDRSSAGREKGRRLGESPGPNRARGPSKALAPGPHASCGKGPHRPPLVWQGGARPPSHPALRTFPSLLWAAASSGRARAAGAASRAGGSGCAGTGDPSPYLPWSPFRRRAGTPARAGNARARLAWRMMRMAFPAPSSATSPYIPDTT